MSHPYQYVVLRFVPRVDRGECLNVGLVLHSQSAGVLRCAWHVDEARIPLWTARGSVGPHDGAMLVGNHGHGETAAGAIVKPVEVAVAPGGRRADPRAAANDEGVGACEHELLGRDAGRLGAVRAAIIAA